MLTRDGDVEMEGTKRTEKREKISLTDVTEAGRLGRIEDSRFRFHTIDARG